MIDARPTWALRRPLLVAISSALVPVVFTALGSAVAQILVLPDPVATLVTAGAVAISALVGLTVMVRSRPGAAALGLRRPARSREAWWYLPLAFVVALNLATSHVVGGSSRLPALIALCVAVG